MKKITTAFLSILFCLTATSATIPIAWSANYEAGLTAYEKANYVTALHEWTYKIALTWNTLAAHQGNARAQYNLGVMYSNGHGVTQDYKTALKWFTRAAQQGEVLAQSNLGWMYRNGKGAPQNHKTALEWYTRAAEQGNARAQSNLGLMFWRGEGLPQNNVYAHMWLNLAFTNGIKKSGERRDNIAEKMTPADVATAQDLARECTAKDYKDC